ncbi:avidin/streptavidin family protein [Marinomonas sp. THO17]|uniref:avidin/streptavidin family protein n=1 Tax=Marinomonas sp. THO17 TaxID=3149048 RepID=UPI00336C00FE
MSLTLNGVWQNSYGSLMTLEVNQSGQIVGEYSSTTGATGTYLVIGYSQPRNPSSDLGQAVVLSIFWRPIDQPAGDDGVHWMSTYCGQLSAEGELTVINTLLTTTPYNKFAPGDYVDKLVFTKTSEQGKPVFSNAGIKDSNDNRINGEWQREDGLAKLSLNIQNQTYGFISGVLTLAGEDIAMLGFTDTYADNNILQSLTLSGYMLSNQQPISLLGRMSLDATQLDVTRWLAHATAPSDVYFQSEATHWRFIKQSID